MNYKYFYNTHIGTLGIAENGYEITHLTFGTNKIPIEYEEKETENIKKCFNEVSEYLEGRRKTFTTKLNPQGTEFQKKVWNALKEIPYGETRTYKQIAERIGNHKASRAVGMANNRNPIGIIIPCHRVIGANGKLVGYAGGLDIKEKLLELEKLTPQVLCQ